MLFGHNSNVKVGDATFHVQTEDRGVSTALIDTTVYFGGRVMHRRTNNYHDLIPLDPDREEALRLRLDEQHRSTLEDIRSGSLYLAPPQPPAPAARPTPNVEPPAEKMPEPSAGPTESAATSEVQPKAASPVTSAATAAALKLDLRNARTWLSGKQARLEIVVSSGNGEPQAGAQVIAHVEGAATAEKYSTETNADGTAELSFTMPRLAGGEAALVIEASQGHGSPHSNGAAHGRLRFALRTKPRAT
jgi:hypothetical protein